MPTLFPFLPFDPVETSVSFATRLAALHTGGRLVPFLHDIGVKPAALVAGDTEAVERLCALAGNDSAQVLRNSARTVGTRRADLRGEEISVEFFSSPDTVYCPACLAEDDAAANDDAGARRGRLLWTIRVVRTCPRHQIALVHRPRQRWDDQFHELAVLVPERGETLLALAERSERRTASSLQNYAVARLDGKAGPEWLDGQKLEQAVRATEMLGALITFGAAAKLSDLNVSEWDHAGRIGYAFTSTGEAGIRAALDQAQAAFDRKSKPGRRKVFGRFYEWLSSTKARKDAGDIKRILREHIFETMEVAPGEVILGETIPHRRLHSVKSLASEAGLDARTLRNVLVARGVIPAENEAGEYHVFDAEAGRAVATSIRRSVHVISLPKALNCTRPQAEQLLDERLLLRVGRFPGEAPGRTQKAVDEMDVAAFLAALRKDARVVEAAPQGLVSIVSAAGKVKVPAVLIVHFILGGLLDTIASLANVDGYSGILVDPNEVRVQVRGMGQNMSASEAFGKLRLPKETGWALVDCTGDVSLKPIMIAGPNGHEYCRFDEMEVSGFADRFTTVTRIANALGIEHREVLRRLKVARIRPSLSRREIGIDLYRTENLPPSCVAG